MTDWNTTKSNLILVPVVLENHGSMNLGDIEEMAIRSRSTQESHQWARRTTSLRHIRVRGKLRRHLPTLEGFLSGLAAITNDGY
jgi:hypothetical protein